jgi:hypothetical protein
MEDRWWNHLPTASGIRTARKGEVMYRLARILCPAALVSLFLVVAVTRSDAEPIQWPGNGHWYERVPDPVTWQEANAAAQSMSWLGLPGHLATLTSAAEDNFVWSSFGVLQDGLWLGGFQDPWDEPDPSANWHWVTGEEWSYTNWYPGEPNDIGDPEFYLAFSVFGHGWNDESDADVFWESGFVVEYEEPLVPVGACCFPSGSCLVGTEVDCEEADGIYVGDGISCDPDPCLPVPLNESTWGRIKARFH